MNENTYIVTDGCMWEQNKKNSTYHPHAIEVVNIETGQVQYIRSGSRIKLIEGDITDLRSQEAYNKATKKLSRNGQNKLHRSKSKKAGDKTVK